MNILLWLLLILHPTLRNEFVGLGKVLLFVGQHIVRKYHMRLWMAVWERKKWNQLIFHMNTLNNIFRFIYAFGNVVTANNGIRLQASSITKYDGVHAECLFDARSQKWQMFERWGRHRRIFVGHNSSQFVVKLFLLVLILTQLKHRWRYCDRCLDYDIWRKKKKKRKHKTLHFLLHHIV